MLAGWPRPTGVLGFRFPSPSWHRASRDADERVERRGLELVTALSRWHEILAGRDLSAERSVFNGRTAGVIP